MKRIATVTLWATLAIALPLAVPGCGGSFVAVRGHDEVAYDYTYYPDSEVYYYPAGSLYYWRDHNEWVHGRELPARFAIQQERGVALHLNTSRPYEMHESIRPSHPGHPYASEDRH